MPLNHLNQPEKQLQIKMPKHSIVALFCLVLPALVVGASLNAKVPVKLEPPVGALANNSDHRIFGGQTATVGQFPYVVQVVKGDFICSGSIISPEWILTAAKCVYGTSTSSVTIWAGTTTWLFGGVTYSVAEIIVHDQYNLATHANDIAVVRVNGQISYTTNVQPVPLTLLPPILGGSLVLTGWGITSNGFPESLQYVGLESIGIIDCQLRLPGYPVSTLANICTLAPVGKGACSGDSGGPLVTQDGVQVGIVSFGTSPCGNAKPDVFISVAAFRVWILAQTGILV